jgi:V8-like Glu-specific endopeptidase/molybdenum-dependent DNA-binding transcriptional regulator ModE
MLHGFAPSAEWLEHVRLSAVRLAGGCSGSFVSPNGLVMTNHHCAARCVEQISSAKKDYIAEGFFAKTEKDEIKCPEIEINELVSITDVTDRISVATRGLDGARFNEANKAEQSRIEKECATSDDVRCDVVSLYHGGRYNLYKYQRYQDTRLVFAPEFATAFFGGDPDNFMFPRYDLDVSFLRVYKNGKPLDAQHYFKWSPAGAKEGDLTFVAGHPWGTDRLLTVSELEFQRDYALPLRLARLAELRGLLTEFQTKGAEEKRISGRKLFGVENSLKAIKGNLAALDDPEVFAAKVAAEKELRAKTDADATLRQAYGGAWDAVADTRNRLRGILIRYQMLEGGGGFSSELFGQARRLLRASTELQKPNEKRLREYVDSQLPAQKQQIFSPAPIYDELEITLLTHSLTKLREELGPDDVVVKKVLGTQSPHELASRLVKGTKLGDPKVRRALFEGGAAAVEASKDPMIELARLVEPDARAVRKIYEDDVEAVAKKNHELIAKARFAIYGTSVYPDATATLRLSFGQVRGWDEGGKPVAPITTFAGAFERATGKEPFALPASWLKNKDKIDLSTPLNFTTTNDIIGGNSGSPVLDKEARIVGLVFDGNIHSLGGDYYYDPKDNRMVAVHSAAIVEALDKIYGATRIVNELRQ